MFIDWENLIGRPRNVSSREVRTSQKCLVDEMIGIDVVITEVLGYKLFVGNAKRRSGIWDGHLTHAAVVNKF